MVSNQRCECCHDHGGCHRCNGHGYVSQFGATITCRDCLGSGECQDCGKKRTALRELRGELNE